MAMRFGCGDRVIPAKVGEWYEWDAGVVTDASPFDGYLVRYPSGHTQTYAHGELTSVDRGATGEGS